jgi:hypothetical protein
MNGLRRAWLCERYQGLRVLLNTDPKGNLTIAVIKGRKINYDRVFLSKEDAEEMSRILLDYARQIDIEGEM